MLCYFEIPWHFKALQKSTIRVEQPFTLPMAAIGGEWRFYATVGEVNFHHGIFFYGVMWKGAKGRVNVDDANVQLWSDGRAVAGGVAVAPREIYGCFPPSDDGRLEGSYSAHREEAFTLKFCCSWPEVSSDQLLPIGKPLAVLERYTTLFDGRHHNNLALVFRHETLWANSKALAEASPYFKRLLESGFEEGTQRIAGEETTGVRSTEADQDLQFDVSDDESAGDTSPTTPILSSSIAPPSCAIPFHEVFIPSASYTLYRALLFWLYTSHITFAPLLSTFRHSPSRDVAAAQEARRAAVTALTTQHPNLPLPSSPKSIYRLAHLLELPDLKKLALAAIKSQLSVSNVAYELFGDVSGCYAEVREMELDFAVEHWAEVKGGAAMREVQQMIEADELPFAASTLAKLAMRL